MMLGGIMNLISVEDFKDNAMQSAANDEYNDTSFFTAGVAETDPEITAALQGELDRQQYRGN